MFRALQQSRKREGIFHGNRSNQKKHRSLPKWSIIFLLISSTALIFFITIYIQRYVTEELQQQQLLTLETVSRKISSNISAELDRQWNHLDYIEATMHFNTYDTKEKVLESLKQVKEAHGLSHTNNLVILIDQRGYYYTPEAGRVALWQADLNAKEPYGNHSAVVLNDLAGLRDHPEEYICFVKKLETPITASDGSSFPYLVLAMDTSVFSIDSSLGRFGTVSDALVIAKNGRKVSSQAKSLELSSSPNLLSALQGAEFVLGDSYGRMLSEIADNQSGSSLIRYHGEVYFIAHHPLGVQDWLAVFIVSDHQMISQVEPFVYRLTLVLALGFTLLFALIGTAILLIRRENRKERLKNAQLQMAAEMAQKASQDKGEFILRISHDIRTPLNGIIGMTAIAAKTLDDRASAESCLKKISSASGHLLDLINVGLDLSKVENGKRTIRNAPLDLRKLFDAMTAINEGRITDKHLAFYVDTGGVKHPHVIADRTILNEILFNITGNAVKYTEAGGTIRCTAYDWMVNEQQAEYHFIIADTGIGMSPEFVGHVFERFAQEEIEARDMYEGTGLGMAITKELVDLLGGQITVESEPGEGSTFEVTLTLSLDTSARDGAPEMERKPVVLDRPYHVLLVDDNALNREVAEFNLREAGITFHSAEDGIQAVEAFKQSAPGEYDGILMDVMMPRMDGRAATRAIRALNRPDAKSIPIFALTANVSPEETEKSLAAGMNAHLTKPVDISEVLKALQNWCK